MSFAFMPLYTDDYLRDTRHLSPTKHGIYLLLLMHCWDSRGPAPIDEQELSGICNCRSSDEIESLRYVLNRFFVRMDDGWYNERIQKEIEKANAISALRAHAGLKGAAAKLGIARKSRVAIAKQMPSNCLANAKQLPSNCQATLGQEPTQVLDGKEDSAVKAPFGKGDNAAESVDKSVDNLPDGPLGEGERKGGVEEGKGGRGDRKEERGDDLGIGEDGVSRKEGYFSLSSLRNSSNSSGRIGGARRRISSHLLNCAAQQTLEGVEQAEPAGDVVGGVPVPACPIDAIIDAYHRHMPTCPRVLVRNASRDGYVRQRWRDVFAMGKAKDRQDAIALFEEFFAYAAKSKFLTGRSAGEKNRKPFVADFEWLMRPNNFAKVVEGRYHDASETAA